MDAARTRLAVVHPYWTLWEHTAGPTFRADRLDLARRVAATLEDAFDIVGVADFASVDEAAARAEGYAAASVDVLLVLQTMAAPSAYALALIERLRDVPVVI